MDITHDRLDSIARNCDRYPLDGSRERGGEFLDRPGYIVALESHSECEIDEK